MELMARYPDNYFDLAIVDPPYGIERFKKGSLRFDKSEKSKNGLQWDVKPSDEYFKELFRVSKNQIVWGANNFIMPTSEYFLIWNKMQTVDNFASAEYAWVSMGLKTPAKVFDYGIHKHNHTDKIHPTQKPIDLYKFILDKYAKQGDKILDTHLGSGSIAIACHDYGFDLTACELDKEYFDKAMQRIKNHTNQQKLF
jgi:site-specific DNA-methyltransferase (adenine-specific)